MRKKYLVVVLLLATVQAGMAQSLPVDSYGQEDYYRREQLAGKGDSAVSFAVRPLLNGGGIEGKNLLQPLSNTRSDTSSGRPVLKLLPFSWQTQYTSHHGYGWNDGAIIPSKGFETLVSSGFFAEYKPLSIQFKPEFVFAENRPFEEFPHAHYEIIWNWYYNYYNFIDLPIRFGNKAYARFNPGQSSVRLNYRSMSLGVSTENLWWGPGIRSSLLMSNSAQGFPHLTLNTRKPVQTSVGSFEGQLIAGKLRGSGFTPPDSGYIYLGTKIFQPKPSDRRFLSGMVLSYQPKWVPGLFLGFSRSSQMYSKDLKSVGDYLPFFSAFNSYSAAEEITAPDRYTSLFMRWLWKESQMEVYMEYGHNDQSRSFTDFMKDPEYGRAYLFGLRKMIPLAKRTDENILIGFETAQLSQSSPDIVRNAGGWYTDQNIRHGYTNRGEMLGAGIGPGGNLQTLDVSWVRGVKRIGLQAERYAHNQDFYYYVYERSKDWRRHWIDLSFAARAEWDYKNFIFNAKFNYIHSFNYGWYLLQTDPDNYTVNGKDANNIQGHFGFTYRFN